MFILKLEGIDHPPPMIPTPIQDIENVEELYPDPPPPPGPIIKLPKFGIPGTPGIGDGIP